MSNTISSELQLTTVLDTALVAFRRAIAPLLSFCTRYSNVPLQGTNKMAVPYYPLATAASQSRAPGGSYKALATATSTQAREIEINKNMVQAISFTSEERRRQPMFDPEMHGRLKGEKLAFDVMADIFQRFRHSDFNSGSIAAVAASNFDENEVGDLAQLCMEGFWPDQGRSLLLNPAFHFNLLKQPQILDFSKSGSQAALREAQINRIMGFEEIGSAGIPTNNGTAFNITGTASSDTINATGHPLNNGDRVIFPTLTGGSGLTAATVAYFVIDAAVNSFKVSATPGGAAVNFTTDISGGTCRRFENIVGMAAMPSALLAGFAPVEPDPIVRPYLADYRIVEDEYSGIVLEYKSIAYPDTDEAVQVIECHYGDATGETAAAKLITTPLS